MLLLEAYEQLELSVASEVDKALGKQVTAFLLKPLLPIIYLEINRPSGRSMQNTHDRQAGAGTARWRGGEEKIARAPTWSAGVTQLSGVLGLLLSFQPLSCPARAHVLSLYHCFPALTPFTPNL